MQSLFFWKSWPREYRIVGYALAALFFFTLVFMWYAYARGVDSVIHWDTIQEQKAIETTVHAFQLGPFQLTVPAESYIIFEYFKGSQVEPNMMASYTFLLVLVLSAIVLLTVITTLGRFWYFTGMALFMVFVISLRLEVLGSSGRLPLIVVLILYLVPSFYFNYFRNSTPVIIRLLVFLIVTAIVTAGLLWYTNLDLPLYHLTITGYTAGLVLSVIFIIMIAHEIFAAFVKLVSQGSTKSLRHFCIISAIYLLNLIITSLHEIGYLQWNFIYINLYLLLTISAVLGIWGFRSREPLYENIFSFTPLGAYTFLAMGAICFATTANLLGNANDPALRIIRHTVIFSHTGYGIIFITYVFSNFILMMARNIPVDKILYKSNRMPYFTYRLAGTIAMLAFIFVAGWSTYVYNGMAGFYNAMGDVYGLLGDTRYQENLYDQGRNYTPYNHRSNYALGEMLSTRFSFEEAHERFEDANTYRPSAYSLTNAGNTYLWENELFKAIDRYRMGLQRMPSSYPLSNNLGFAYAKIHNLDSANVYLDRARADDFTKNTAETNFFAMLATEMIPVKTDSVLRTFNTTAAGTMANALALGSLYNEPVTVNGNPLAAKRLNLHTATFLNNYVIRNAKKLDTTFVKEAYRIAADSLNADFSEALKATMAFAFYHQGNVAKALEILAEQVYMSQSYQGKFNYIMGLWALEQGNPQLAASYFSYADTYELKEARFYNAIALTESRNLNEALVAWDSVELYDDEGEQQIAARMKRILTLSPQQALTLTDGEKYQFCRYRITLADSLIFNKLVGSFENANYKGQALLDISQRYFKGGYTAPAIRYFNRMAGLELTNKRLYDDMRHFELRMLASRKELRLLATQINKGIEFDPGRTLDKMLYTALMNELNGDTTQAKKQFDVLGTYNPYFEEGIIAAAEFFKALHPKSMKPYTFLSEAIQINANSYRLLKAYAAEARRKGFDDYAMSAEIRANEIMD